MSEPFHPSQRWPRIRDLPEHEREPFRLWLSDQPRPTLIDDIQDGYYGWDYSRWKQSANELFQ